MLQSIRDKSKGLIAGLLIGFLVIIFALSGSEALFSGGGNTNEVLQVNGEPVTENAVRREIYRQREQIRNQYGDSVPSEMVSEDRLREPAIDALVQRRLLEQFARDNGMGVGEQHLDEMLMSFPQFAGDDGEFDPQRYQQVLRSMGYTPAQYKSVLRRELLINQLAGGVQGSSFVTQGELSRFAALNFQERSFRYATLNRERVADQVSISDEEIETFYNENPDAFRRPEQVAVNYIELSVDGLMNDIEIDEQTLREQYEKEREAEAQQDAQRRVSHILLESGDTESIEAVQQALSEGEDFAELAREYSQDLGTSEQGGDLGFVSAEGMPEPFMASVEALEKGQVSEPVDTEAGVHFIKVTDTRASGTASFEEERERIAEQLKRVRAENRFVNLMERLGDLSYNADTLAPVAEELGLEVGNTDWFSRQGGSGIAGNQSVVEAAFSEEVLKRGNSSDLIELASDRVVVVKKDQHREAQVKPLEEVRDQIRAQLRGERIRSRLADRGKQLQQALADGQSLDALAEQEGLTVETAESVRRNARELDRQLLSHVFALARPGEEPVISGVNTRAGYTLVVLTDVQEGEWASLSEQQRTSLSNRLRSMQGNRAFVALRESLRQNADIAR